MFNCKPRCFGSYGLCGKFACGYTNDCIDETNKYSIGTFYKLTSADSHE